MITIEKSYKRLYQRTVNQRILIDGNPEGTLVYLSRREHELPDIRPKVGALIVVAYADKGAVYASIPDEVLKKPGKLYVCIYGANDLAVDRTEFRVIPRPRPNGIAYTDDEIYEWEEESESEKVAPGASAYEIAVANGFEGDEAWFGKQLAFGTPFVTPQMFGAKGDGVTDDTEAFKECFKHYSIFIPAGTYIISETIEVLNKSNIWGNTRESTEIVGTSDIVFNCAGFASFSTIRIKGNGSNTGIVFPQHNLQLRLVDLRSLNIGIRSNGENTVKFNSFERCIFYGVKYPLWFESATAQTNTTSIIHCTFRDFSKVITAPFVYALNFDTCSFLCDNTDSFILDVVVAASTSFVSCYIEDHGKLATENCDYGNITIRSTWIYRPNGVFLSMDEPKSLYVKFVESTIINSDSDEDSCDAHIDGANLNVDIVDCITALGSKSGRLLKITSADVALQYGVAKNCIINGGYLTLDTLPLYNGEVE